MIEIPSKTKWTCRKSMIKNGAYKSRTGPNPNTRAGKRKARGWRKHGKEPANAMFSGQGGKISYANKRVKYHG